MNSSPLWAQDSNLPNAPFYKSKLTAATYWMERMVPECPMLLERIQAGSETVMEFE
ncbi:MAG: acyl-CoA dehydrogenase C-terminal domain-containing protein [Proteobacteria bacterium]|nr:acyl-CoA dehydrogenase C-terminal domain-containing protein [Pseudomonadota bacterium]